MVQWGCVYFLMCMISSVAVLYPSKHDVLSIEITLVQLLDLGGTDFECYPSLSCLFSLSNHPLGVMQRREYSLWHSFLL